MQQVTSFQIPTIPLLFPRNQRVKNKMIYYAHHRKCVTSHGLDIAARINFLIHTVCISKKKKYAHTATNYFIILLFALHFSVDPKMPFTYYNFPKANNQYLYSA